MEGAVLSLPPAPAMVPPVVNPRGRLQSSNLPQQPSAFVTSSRTNSSSSLDGPLPSVTVPGSSRSNSQAAPPTTAALSSSSGSGATTSGLVLSDLTNLCPIGANGELQHGAASLGAAGGLKRPPSQFVIATTSSTATAPLLAILNANQHPQAHRKSSRLSDVPTQQHVRAASHQRDRPEHLFGENRPEGGDDSVVIADLAVFYDDQRDGGTTQSSNGQGAPPPAAVPRPGKTTTSHASKSAAEKSKKRAPHLRDGAQGGGLPLSPLPKDVGASGDASPAPFLSRIPPPPPVPRGLNELGGGRSGGGGFVVAGSVVGSVGGMAGGGVDFTTITVPPPPSRTSTANNANAAAVDTKLLSKYHFLKNFNVKPKTPSSAEKRAGGAGHRGGHRRDRNSGVSPLPVKPLQHVSKVESPAEQGPLMATALPAAVVLHDHTTNDHRTIPSIPAHQQPNMPPSSPAVALDQLPPDTSAALPTRRAIAVEAMPELAAVSMNALATAVTPVDRQLRRHTTLDAFVLPVAATASAHHPPPGPEPEVARNLLDDMLDTATPLPQHGARPLSFRNSGSTAGMSPIPLDDDEDHAASSDAASRESGAPFVGRVRSETHPSLRRQCSNSERGCDSPTNRHAASEALVNTTVSPASSYAMPSPTTLGSTGSSRSAIEEPYAEEAELPEGSATIAPNSGTLQSPQSVAETVEGSDLFELEVMDEDDYFLGGGGDRHTQSRNSDAAACCDVSELDDEAIVMGADVDSEEAPKDRRRAALESFFQASGIAPAASTHSSLLAAASMQYAQLHVALGTKLIHEQHVSVVRRVMSDVSLQSALLHTLTMQRDDMVSQMWRHKLELTFLFGYNRFVAFEFALPQLESHGRRLILMRRDLFMRGSVRKFIRTRPIGSSVRRSHSPPLFEFSFSKIFGSLLRSDAVVSDEERVRKAMEKYAVKGPKTGPKKLDGSASYGNLAHLLAESDTAEDDAAAMSARARAEAAEASSSSSPSTATTPTGAPPPGAAARSRRLMHTYGDFASW